MPLARVRVLAAVSLFALAACGERTSAAERALGDLGKAAQQVAHGIDASVAVARVGTALEQVQRLLRQVTDGPTAQRTAAELDAAVADLRSAYGDLGAVTREVDRVLASVGTSRAQVFAALRTRVDAAIADPQVRAAIGPLLQRLQQLAQ